MLPGAKKPRGTRPLDRSARGASARGSDQHAKQYSGDDKPHRNPLIARTPLERLAHVPVASEFLACPVANAVLVTRVEGSLLPNWIGNNHVRTCGFRDGLLALPRTVGGQAVTSGLIWERAGPGPPTGHWPPNTDY